jgi:hypothetical protein
MRINIFNRVFFEATKKGRGVRRRKADGSQVPSRIYISARCRFADDSTARLAFAGNETAQLVSLALSYDVGENPRNGRTKAINLRRLAAG